jgi:hypothetical protein
MLRYTGCRTCQFCRIGLLRSFDFLDAQVSSLSATTRPAASVNQTSVFLTRRRRLSYRAPPHNSVPTARLLSRVHGTGITQVKMSRVHSITRNSTGGSRPCWLSQSATRRSSVFSFTSYRLPLIGASAAQSAWHSRSLGTCCRSPADSDSR